MKWLAFLFIAVVAVSALYCPVKCWLGLPVVYCNCGYHR